MALRHLLMAALAAALVAASGCGAPDRLDDSDDRELAAAREGLDDALDTEETIRTSPAMGRKLADRVERAGDDPAAVERAVPSLADDGQVDTRAAEAFVRYAATDAPRALLIPAEREVGRIIEVVEDSDADSGTEVPHARDRPMDRFLDEVERDIREVWPTLAKELEEAL